MTRPGERRSTREDGAAVVEFALVSVLVLVLLLGVVQLALVLHVRNCIEAAAADGARYGAADGRDPDAGAARTRSLITSAVGRRFADDVNARREDADGLATVEVDVRARLPLVAVWGPAGVMTVRAHALDESP